jgi:hypothetical protein
MKQMPALRDEETIVWEGHPDTGLSFGIGTLASGIFAGALVLACLGLATVIDRAYAGSYWSILAPGIVLGLIIVLAAPMYRSWQRKGVSYFLTNERALIVGTQTRTFEIAEIERISLDMGTLGSVWFGKRETKRTGTGFERIADAQDVHQTLIKLAEGYA